MSRGTQQLRYVVNKPTDTNFALALTENTNEKTVSFLLNASDHRQIRLGAFKMKPFFSRKISMFIRALITDCEQGREAAVSELFRTRTCATLGQFVLH